MKTRYGRGFTLEEIKQAGLNANYARSIGIAVDHRRLDTSLETRDLNVKRLKAYLAKLILFPSKTSRRLAKKTEEKKGEPMTDGKKKERKTIIPEATTEKLNSAAVKEQSKSKKVMALGKAKLRAKPQSITAEMKATKSFVKLRTEKVKERYVGVRKKRAELAKQEAAAAEAKPTEA